MITEHFLKVLNGYPVDRVCHIFPDDIPVWIHSTDTNIAHRTHIRKFRTKEEVAEGGNITLAICMMTSHDRTLATLVEVTLHITMKEEVVHCIKDMKVEMALCGMV